MSINDSDKDGADEAAEGDQDTDLAEILSRMTDAQLKFWELMNEPGYTQERAYREAYDVKPTRTRNCVARDASILWNCSKFRQARRALMNTVVERSARTLEFRIAEMEAFAERAESKGQFGAAFQARQAVGKLEGHYVEKRQNITNHRRDELQILLQLAREGGASKEYALKEAESMGLSKELKKELSTLH